MACPAPMLDVSECPVLLLLIVGIGSSSWLSDQVLESNKYTSAVAARTLCTHM